MIECPKPRPRKRLDSTLLELLRLRPQKLTPAACRLIADHIESIEKQLAKAGDS